MNTSLPHVQDDMLDMARVEIIDVRAHASEAQFRGALRYDPKELLNTDHLTLPLAHDRTIAVYGDSEQTIEDVVDHLRENGYHAAVLDGGLELWTEQGLPIEPLTQEQPIVSR